MRREPPGRSTTPGYVLGAQQTLARLAATYFELGIGGRYDVVDRLGIIGVSAS
jgi:hypothetical protein